MSNCGNCRNSVCNCIFQSDTTTTEILGVGTSHESYQVRALSPAYRPITSVRRTSAQTITADTDVAISFQATDLPFAAAVVNMWQVGLPTRITIPFDGLYLVGGYVATSNRSAGETLRLWVSKNGVSGTPIVKRTVNQSNGGYGLLVSTMTLVRLVQGDFLELYVRVSNSGAGNPTTVAVKGAHTPGSTFNAFPYFWASYIGAY